MDSKIIDTETYQFIVQNVKLLNNDIPDELLTYFIDETIHNLTINTNRAKFPKGLRYLAIDIVNDLYKESQANTDPNSTNTIQSMSEDGRNVTFGASDYEKTRMNLYLQQKIANNEMLIKRFRLLYKVRCPLDEQD